MAYSQYVNVDDLPRPEATSLPTDLPPNSDLNKMKKYVRNGKWTLAQGTRRHLWKHILNISYAKVSDCPAIETFRAQKAAFFEEQGQERNLRVPKMVQGDFPLSIYHLNKEGVTSLQVVLTVISFTYPQISYCPLLAPIASLCLHWMTEEETYAALCDLILKEFNEAYMMYLPTNTVSYTALCNSLLPLAIASDMHQPDECEPHGKSFNNMRNLVNPREQLSQWIWWIFRDLPLSYLVRIMDCYLVEGLKVFYRVALTILQLHKKQSNNNALEEDAIRNFIKNLSSSTTEEKFIKSVYKLKAPTRDEITKAVEHAKELARTSSNGSHENGGHHQSVDTGVSMGPGNSIVLETIKSNIIDQEQLHKLWLWLPPKSSVFQPTLLYQTHLDGFNLSQLYRKIESHQPVILIINTLNKEVFGAYISVMLKERHKYDKGMGFFGDGQTFLFSLSPRTAKYSWTNRPQDHGSSLFVSAQNERLVVGGGNHEGVAIDWAMDKGVSRTCTTFNNPPLCSTPDFSICNVEVIGLRDD
ncbi:GTPase-activating protein skywalker-like isoform X2 [Symsagittifera roscoffensis]|uniref:GTPase-activating protein skywalker-like isoform X2 n=1 Tax=Symsagittifera roscoffensis TaxID=84072 RepID=UPI00307C0271